MGTLNGKRILLIGGGGFIGHNVAIRLKELGADISIVDGVEVNHLISHISERGKLRHRSRDMEILFQRLDEIEKREIPFFVQDARNYHKLAQFFLPEPPEVVIHLAAVAHANRSNKDPYSTFDHSLRTLENALDCARNGTKHFIYFSSSMVYGNFPDGHVTEATPCEPLGIYGALKLAGEKMVTSYQQVFGLPYTIVRPSALYGERCISRRVVQAMIEDALAGKPLTMMGDGSDSLDFTYINDVCSGLEKIILSEASKQQIFNLTYGSSRTIVQLVDLIRKEIPNVEVKQTPRDELVPSRGTLSVEKAKKLIGYEPKWPLEKGLVEYMNWYRSLPQRS